MRFRGFAALASAWILCGVTGLHAQLNHAIVEGVVTDPQGAVVAGANVTLRDLETNVKASSKTNGTGYYRLVDLTPGRYDLRFDAPGFSATDVKGIQVPAGEVVRIDEKLR